MTFRRGARLDPSQIRDRRGVSRGGIAAGGGAVGVIALLVIYFLGGNLGGTGGPGPLGGGLDDLLGQGVGGPQASSDLDQRCRTGEDANTQSDCRIVGYVNSIQAYWSAELGSGYQAAQTTFFSGQTNTGCGGATSATGPFYCPADGFVYIDLDFFKQLESQFGASGGPFAQGYVIGHEYGHHIQNLLGVLRGRSTPGAEGEAVRIELQADCYAGVWAANAVDTRFLEPLTETEVNDALSAAEAVGDDRIQEEMTGDVNPETWTHGSSEQRKQWFSTGYRDGDPAICDTFNADL